MVLDGRGQEKFDEGEGESFSHGRKTTVKDQRSYSSNKAFVTQYI